MLENILCSSSLTSVISSWSCLDCFPSAVLMICVDWWGWFENVEVKYVFIWACSRFETTLATLFMFREDSLSGSLFDNESTNVGWVNFWVLDVSIRSSISVLTSLISNCSCRSLSLFLSSEYEVFCSSSLSCLEFNASVSISMSLSFSVAADSDTASCSFSCSSFIFSFSACFRFISDLLGLWNRSMLSKLSDVVTSLISLLFFGWSTSLMDKLMFLGGLASSNSSSSFSEVMYWSNSENWMVVCRLG